PQGDGRGAFPARLDQGRVRDRDVVAGHQHAGTRCGGLVVHEIRRRQLLHADHWRADAANGSRGTARNRRHRARRDPQRSRRRGWDDLRGGDGPDACGRIQVSAELQHGPQPAARVHAGGGRGTHAAVVRTVPEAPRGLRRRRAAGQCPATARGRSPRFGELLQRYGEIRTLQQELDRGQREATGQMDEYPRKLRRLSAILSETGFLKSNKPTDKGLFAARVYGENTILVAEAVWLG